MALRCRIVADHAVIELTAAQTHPLRLDVLRRDTPSRHVAFPEDELPGTLHLGVELDGVVVGVSTWIENDHPDLPAARGVQLRGMATAPHLQGHGIGGLLSNRGSSGRSRPDTNWSGPVPATRRSASTNDTGSCDADRATSTWSPESPITTSCARADRFRLTSVSWLPVSPPWRPQDDERGMSDTG